MIMLDRQLMEEYERHQVNAIGARIQPAELFELGNTRVLPEYEFRKPYGVWTGGIPLYAVLPFYKQLIVHIDPINNPEKFRSVYGLSIQEIVELREEGRLIVLLRAPYRAYDSLFNPLLKDHVPRNNRVETIFARTASLNVEDYRHFLEARYPEPKTRLSKKFRHDLAGKSSGANVWSHALDSMSQRMLKLEMIGLGEQAKVVVESNDLERTYEILHSLNRALAVPVIDALGGWDNIDAEHMDLIGFDLDATAREENQILLPREVMFWIESQLHYRYPLKVASGTQFLDRILEMDECTANHEILLKLSKELNAGQIGRSEELVHESQKLLSKLKRRIMDLEHKSSHFDKWIGTPLRYGTFAISAFSFSLAANWYFQKDPKSAVCWGAIGAAHYALHQRSKKITDFLTTLRNGPNTVPVLLWKRFRRRILDTR